MPAKTTLFAWPIWRLPKGTEGLDSEKIAVEDRPFGLAEGLDSAKIPEGNFRQLTRTALTPNPR